MNTIAAIFRYVTIGTLALAIGLTSCKRKSKDEVDPDPDLTTERDISNADNDANSLLSDIDKAFDNPSSNNLREEATYYATIIRKDTSATINGIAYDKVLTIIYSGTTADDGQTRNGSVKVLYTGARVTQNLHYYATFSGTKVGGRTLTGIKKVAQEPSGNANQWKFNVTASGTVTTVDGRTLTYTSARTRVRTGINSVTLTDDSFTITGSWSGSNADGETVTAVISSPLQLAYSCWYFREITSGKIDFTNSSRATTRSVDFGSGGCDGKGTFINAKGRVFTFYFKR